MRRVYKTLQNQHEGSDKAEWASAKPAEGPAAAIAAAIAAAAPPTAAIAPPAAIAAPQEKERSADPYRPSKQTLHSGAPSSSAKGILEVLNIYYCSSVSHAQAQAYERTSALHREKLLQDAEEIRTMHQQKQQQEQQQEQLAFQFCCKQQQIMLIKRLIIVTCSCVDPLKDC